MTTFPETDRQRAHQRIAEIRARFIGGLDARLETLSQLARDTVGADGAAAWDGLRLGLHNLAGGAPSLGLVDLGRRAAEIEAIAIDRRQPDGGLSEAVAAQVADAVMGLRAEVPRQ